MRNKTNLGLIILFMLTSSTRLLIAQTYFESIYGGNSFLCYGSSGKMLRHNITPAPPGNIIVGLADHGTKDLMVTRTDQNGNSAWALGNLFLFENSYHLVPATPGNAFSALGVDIVEKANGTGFITCGYDEITHKPFVVSLDNYGGVNWSKYIDLLSGGAVFDIYSLNLKWMIESNNFDPITGYYNYYMVGSVGYYKSGILTQDILIISMAENGILNWVHNYDLNEFESANSILEDPTNANQFFVVGSSQNGAPPEHPFIMKIDNSGNVLLGATAFLYEPNNLSAVFNSIRPTSVSGMYLLGGSISCNYTSCNGNDALLMSMDLSSSSGTAWSVNWAVSSDLFSLNITNSVQDAIEVIDPVTTNPYYYGVGWADVPGRTREMTLLKVDLWQNPVVEACYGGPSGDWGWRMDSDGGNLNMYGTSMSKSLGPPYQYLVSTDMNGVSPCQYLTRLPVIDNVSFTSTPTAYNVDLTGVTYDLTAGTDIYGTNIVCVAPNPNAAISPSKNNKDEVTISPNPAILADNSLSISFNTKANTINYSIEIFDMLGRRIFSKEGKTDISANSINVDLKNISGLMPGLYMLRATVNGKSESHNIRVIN